MKNLFILTILAFMSGFFGTFETAAQQTDAKDLYTQNGNRPNSSQGARVSVLLKRGNLAERVVSTNEIFYSGDRIKLIFDINFTGYAAILNIGPTGNKTLLFPYLNADNRLIDHRVSPNAGTQLPRGNDWIVFDDETGTEQITVIFSKKPIARINNYEAAVTSRSDGKIVTGAEADQILAELNRKSLSRPQSKDLFTQTTPDGTYGVAQNGLGNEPAAFTFYLKHR